MSRRSKSKRVLAQPDPIYNSRLVTLLIVRVLKSGKKSIAQKIVYNALGLSPNTLLIFLLYIYIYMYI